MIQNRRRMRRKDTEPIVTNCKILSKEFVAVLRNISETGACFHTIEDLQSGEKLQVEIKLVPKLPSLKNIPAKIAWKNNSGLYGLRFLSLTEEAVEVIQGFIS